MTPVWPWKDISHLKVWASQSFIVLFTPPDARYFPSGEKITQKIVSWAFISAMHLEVTLPKSWLLCPHLSWKQHVFHEEKSTLSKQTPDIHQKLQTSEDMHFPELHLAITWPWCDVLPIRRKAHTVNVWSVPLESCNTFEGVHFPELHGAIIWPWCNVLSIGRKTHTIHLWGMLKVREDSELRSSEVSFYEHCMICLKIY